jgi:hypothetical protein
VAKHGAVDVLRQLGGHHFLELVEREDPIAVGVVRRDHLLAAFDRQIVSADPQPPQHVSHLLGGDHAVLVRVELVERGARVRRLVAALHHGQELVEADEPVPVKVRGGDHLLHRLVRAAVGLAHLRRRDAAVAVRVQQAEHAHDLRVGDLGRWRLGAVVVRSGGARGLLRRRRRTPSAEEAAAAGGGGGGDETHAERARDRRLRSRSRLRFWVVWLVGGSFVFVGFARFVFDGTVSFETKTVSDWTFTSVRKFFF